MGKWYFIGVLLLISTLGIATLDTNNPYLYGKAGILGGGNPIEKVIERTSFDLEDVFQLQ